MEAENKKKIAGFACSLVKRPSVSSVSNIMEDIAEDEDFDEKLQFILMKECTNRTRGPRRVVPRLQGYCEQIVPQYDWKTFQSHFRLEPHVLDALENLISLDLLRNGTNGRPTISPRQQILSTIWILATPDSYRSVGEKFGMGKGSLHDCVCRVVESINKIARQHIVWPEGREKENVKQSFLRLAGIPNIVGAIDGCHINIEAPNEHPSAYRTGKKKYAIHLQGVCTPDLLFIDCFAGYPASVHDSRVLRNSPLARDAAEVFVDGEFIIGDKAYYPVRTWCIPPYKDNGHLTQPQKHFNKCHARSRQVIERAFALLKGRFRRLKFLPMTRMDRMPHVIMACCVLHNICIRNRVNDSIDEYIREGGEIEVTFNNTDSVLERDQAAGLSKRDYLKDLLCPS